MPFNLNMNREVFQLVNYRRLLNIYNLFTSVSGVLLYRGGLYRSQEVDELINLWQNSVTTWLNYLPFPTLASLGASICCRLSVS